MGELMRGAVSLETPSGGRAADPMSASLEESVRDKVNSLVQEIAGAAKDIADHRKKRDAYSKKDEEWTKLSQMIRNKEGRVRELRKEIARTIPPSAADIPLIGDADLLSLKDLKKWDDLVEQHEEINGAMLRRDTFRSLLSAMGVGRKDADGIFRFLSWKKGRPQGAGVAQGIVDPAVSPSQDDGIPPSQSDLSLVNPLRVGGTADDSAIWDRVEQSEGDDVRDFPGVEDPVGLEGVALAGMTEEEQAFVMTQNGIDLRSEVTHDEADPVSAIEQDPERYRSVMDALSVKAKALDAEGKKDEADAVYRQMIEIEAIYRRLEAARLRSKPTGPAYGGGGFGVSAGDTPNPEEDVRDRAPTYGGGAFGVSEGDTPEDNTRTQDEVPLGHDPEEMQELLKSTQEDANPAVIHPGEDEGLPKKDEADQKNLPPLPLEIATTMKERFGIEGKDLESIEGLRELSLGQQKLVMENLAQFAVGSIYANAADGHTAAIEEAKKHVPRLYGILGSTVGGFLGRMHVGLKEAFTKKFDIGRREKSEAREVRQGGIEAHRATLELLVRGMREHGPDVTDDMRIRFAPTFEGKDAPITEADRAVIDRFNVIAQRFSEVPFDWSYPDATKKEQHAFKKAQTEYLQAKAVLLRVRESTVHDERANLEWMTEVDARVNQEQWMTRMEGDALKRLAEIEDQRVWTRALQSVGAERGAYFALGFASKSIAAAAVGLTAASAAPLGVIIGAGFAGGVISRIRAGSEIKERDERARRGFVDKSVEAKNMVSARNEKAIGDMGQVHKLEYLIDALEHYDEYVSLREGGQDETPEKERFHVRTKEELRTALANRVGYLKRKISEGKINLGPTSDRLANEYALLRAIARANVVGAGATLDPKVWDKLNPMLQGRDEAIEHARGKKLRKRFMTGAVFGALAAEIGNEIREYTTSGISADGGLEEGEKLASYEDDLPPVQTTAEVDPEWLKAFTEEMEGQVGRKLSNLEIQALQQTGAYEDRPLEIEVPEAERTVQGNLLSVMERLHEGAVAEESRRIGRPLTEDEAREVFQPLPEDMIRRIVGRYGFAMQIDPAGTLRVLPMQALSSDAQVAPREPLVPLEETPEEGDAPSPSDPATQGGVVSQAIMIAKGLAERSLAEEFVRSSDPTTRAALAQELGLSIDEMTNRALELGLAVGDAHIAMGGGSVSGGSPSLESLSEIAEVEPGDTLTRILDRSMGESRTPMGTPIYEAFLRTYRSFTPEELRQVGIRSGEADLIRPDEKIDLMKLRSLIAEKEAALASGGEIATDVPLVGDAEAMPEGGAGNDDASMESVGEPFADPEQTGDEIANSVEADVPEGEEATADLEAEFRAWAQGHEADAAHEALLAEGRFARGRIVDTIFGEDHPIRGHIQGEDSSEWQGIADRTVNEVLSRRFPKGTDPDSGVGYDRPRTISIARRLVDRVESISGVESSPEETVDAYLERALAVMRGQGTSRIATIKEALYDVRADDVPMVGLFLEDDLGAQVGGTRGIEV
jgi:hypothetical protein